MQKNTAHARPLVSHFTAHELKELDLALEIIDLLLFLVKLQSRKVVL